MLGPEDFRVPRLGPATRPSPLGLSTRYGDLRANYTPEWARVLLEPDGRSPELAFERAGARERIHFDPGRLRAGIVTCGGLCPGLNDVVQGLVRALHAYGVQGALGFRYGYLGLTRSGPEPVELGIEAVEDIHLQGGSVLGSSRGPQDPAEMVDVLGERGVDALFCVGGDGTLRGALAIQREIERRGLPVAVVGVPKTIDNDIPYIERTFGFETAMSVATQAIRAAWVEARGAPRGLGLVKLMGRHSGFVAASAALASGVADLCLVPELPFALDGPRGVLAWLERLLDEQGHAVVVVAEGAGQDLLPDTGERDASGNRRLGDIGAFLRDRFRQGLPGVNLKYIDPSYLVRAAPANPADALFCRQLAEHAVHAALAGRTGLVVGLWNGAFTHVPLPLATSGRKTLSPDGPLWRSVVEATGQPALFPGD